MRPGELMEIGLDPARYKRAAEDEYHGPCPRCGGVDRFVIHADRAWPHWFMWCRKCGWRGWPDQINAALSTITDEERARWTAEREAARAAEQARRRKALDDYTASELWEAYAAKMAESNHEWWRKAGIADEWQAYWRLGYTPSAPVASHGPAYTIPYFFRGKPVNLQYRLETASADKYRWASLGYTSPFVAFDDLGFDGREVLVVEGAKKAMVTGSRLYEAGHDLQVAAVPSKSDFAGIDKLLSKAALVYVLLDPDGDREAERLALTIGDHARVATLDEKVDDRVLETSINAVLNRLPHARKPTTRRPR